MAFSPSASREFTRSAHVIDEYGTASFDTAIENKSAPFDYLVAVIRGMKCEDKEHREICSRYYPDILKAFESKWGRVHYILVMDFHALVLTQKSHMFHEEALLDLASLELIHRCDKLQTEAHRLLRNSEGEGSELRHSEGEGSELRHSELFCCMDMVVELLSHLFASMEQLVKKKIKQEEHDKLVFYLQKELASLEENFIRCAQRRARYKYYLGMITGLGVVTIIDSLISLFLYALKVPINIIAAVFGSIITGGIGAIISVMTRMSNKKFPLDHEAGPEQNNRLGLFRPIIGATMGVVLYFLIMSDLIPLELPTNSSKELFYILSIAFSAGFTERWAQDMLPGKKNDEEITEKEPSVSASPPVPVVPPRTAEPTEMVQPEKVETPVTMAPPATEDKNDSRENPG